MCVNGTRRWLQKIIGLSFISLVGEGPQGEGMCCVATDAVGFAHTAAIAFLRRDVFSFWRRFFRVLLDFLLIWIRDNSEKIPLIGFG